MTIRRAVFSLLACGLVPPASATGTPEDTVREFNAALSANQVQQAVGRIAAGGLQFNLHSAHADLATGDPPLTQDLAALWQVVSTVLFNATEGYQRRINIVDARTDGDVATVWTTTETLTRRGKQSEPSRLEFSEVYLLLRLEGAWKIAAVANNRPPAETSRP